MLRATHPRWLCTSAADKLNHGSSGTKPRSLARPGKVSVSTCSVLYTARALSINSFPTHSHQGLVVQKPVNINPRLKVNQGVYFFNRRCCSTMIFSKTLHKKKSILKNKNKQKKPSTKSGKYETKVYGNPGLI